MKKNLKERYDRMKETDWWKAAYDNKSIGEIIEIDNLTLEDKKVFGNELSKKAKLKEKGK